MTTLINTNPYGAIELAHVGVPSPIERGESFDVSPELAGRLLGQIGNYGVPGAAELETLSAEVLHTLAAARGCDAKTKAGTIEALSGALVVTPDPDADPA